MVLPLEEQFQAEMGARLNPRQPLSKPLSYSDIAPEQMAIAREQLGQQPGPTSGILPSGEQLRPSYTDALSSSLGGQIQGGQAALDFFGGALGGIADTGKRLTEHLLPPYSLDQQSFEPWFKPKGTAATLGRSFVSETLAGVPEGPWKEPRSTFDAALTMVDAFDPSNFAGDALKGLVKSGKVFFDEGGGTLSALTGVIPSFKQREKLKGTVVTDTGKVGGNPIPVYHGSNIPIDNPQSPGFKIGYEEQGLAGPGIYFTTHPGVAGGDPKLGLPGYSQKPFKKERSPGEIRTYEELIDPDTGEIGKAATVQPAYLNLKKVFDWNKPLDVDVVNNWIKKELTDKVPGKHPGASHFGNQRPSDRLKLIFKDEVNEYIDLIDGDIADEYNDFASWFNNHVPFDSSYTSQLPGQDTDFLDFVSELEELGVTRRDLDDILDAGGLKTMKIDPSGFTNIHGQQVIPPHSKYDPDASLTDIDRAKQYDYLDPNNNLASRTQLVVGHNGNGYNFEYEVLEKIKQTGTFKMLVPNDVPLGKEGTWDSLDHYQALVNKIDNIVWDDTNKVWRNKDADLIPEKMWEEGYDQGGLMTPKLDAALDDWNNYSVVDFDFGKEYKAVVDDMAAGYTGQTFTNEDWYNIMDGMYNYMDNPNRLANKSRANNFLSREGFQGITHVGGGRTQWGVEHQAYIVFPDLAAAPFGSPNPFGFKTSQNPWTHLFESGANIVRDDYGIWHDQFPKGYSGRIFPEWAQLEGEVPQPITSDMIEMIRQTGKR